MRRKILLADDSPTIQRLVTNTFADGDFDIISVSNGEAAIRKFDEIRPNVVLADIYMPGKNGYEVCSYVRHHPSLGGTPVVLLVGAFDAFDEEKAREAGATSNITKPFEPQALVSLVESVTLAATDERIPVPDPTAVPVAAVKEFVASPVVEPPPVVQIPEMQSVEIPELPAVEIRHHEDVLGLQSLFPEATPSTGRAAAISEQDIDRIADRVIKRISRQVIETVAWEVVPDIVEKIVREELQKKR